MHAFLVFINSFAFVFPVNEQLKKRVSLTQDAASALPRGLLATHLAQHRRDPPRPSLQLHFFPHHTVEAQGPRLCLLHECECLQLVRLERQASCKAGRLRGSRLGTCVHL
jgi:hypothetical protein